MIMQGNKLLWTVTKLESNMIVMGQFLSAATQPCLKSTVLEIDPVREEDDDEDEQEERGKGKERTSRASPLSPPPANPRQNHPHHHITYTIVIAIILTMGSVV